MQDRAGHAGRAVPVAEAAARLGLRPETLRKQLARGRTPGLKRHRQWIAVLDDVPPVQDRVLDHAGPDPAVMLDDAEPDAGPVQRAEPDVPPVLHRVLD